MEVRAIQHTRTSPTRRQSMRVATLSFNTLEVLPDRREWDGEYLFEMLMLDGTWHYRRIVLTKDFILIARSTEENVIDSIPFGEIDQVLLQHEGEGKKGGAKKAASAAGIIATAVTKNNKVANDNPGRDRSESNEGLPTSTGENDAEHEAKDQNAANSGPAVLQVKTVAEGYNSGRTYYARIPSYEAGQNVASSFLKAAEMARLALESKSSFRKSQDFVRKIFNSRPCQFGAALLILANFIINAAQAQLNGSLLDSNGNATPSGEALNAADTTLTIIFAIELLVNMYAHWFVAFFANQYNVIDFVVVAFSLASMGALNGPISILRMTRAMRVVRLFGRLQAFRNILNALTASIIPVANAFVLLLLVIAIYAIIGVTYFGDTSPQDFGTFDRAMIALFRLPAGDAWVDSLPAVSADGTTNFGAVVFLDSFILVVCWTLLPITLAILVNNYFINTSAMEEEQLERQREEEGHNNLITYPLDPLVENLTRHYVDDADLSDRLQRIFHDLDTDDSGSISFRELCTALKKLNVNPRIHMTDSDFASVTENGRLCGSDGTLGAAQFEAAMRNQIRHFAQRRLADALVHGPVDAAEFAQLAALKVLLLEPSRRDGDDLEAAAARAARKAAAAAGCFSHTSSSAGPPPVSLRAACEGVALASAASQKVWEPPAAPDSAAAPPPPLPWTPEAASAAPSLPSHRPAHTAAALLDEVRGGMAAVRRELREEMGGMRGEVAALRDELRRLFPALTAAAAAAGAAAAGGSGRSAASSASSLNGPITYAGLP